MGSSWDIFCGIFMEIYWEFSWDSKSSNMEIDETVEVLKHIETHGFW